MLISELLTKHISTESLTVNIVDDAVLHDGTDARRSPKLEENFKDHKGPGRPGDSQRHGIPRNATMAQLEKHAQRPGRAGQLARWQINMRRGRKKS